MVCMNRDCDDELPPCNDGWDYIPSYKQGDIVMKNGKPYCYDGSKWNPMTKYTDIKSYIGNCPNCGAPMKNHKCEYCGTERR